jgi:hypothetical protein
MRVADMLMTGDYDVAVEPLYTNKEQNRKKERKERTLKAYD